MKVTAYVICSLLGCALSRSVKAQVKVGDQPTSLQKSVALDVQGSSGKQGLWLPRISDTSNTTGIDALNPPDGMLIYHTTAKKLMIRTNGYWYPLITGTSAGIANIVAGTVTLSGPDIIVETGTAAGTGKDFNIVATAATNKLTFNLPDAAVDTRGVINTTAQTFNGLKTFNSGLTSSSTTTISGNAANASNLYLGVTSATTTSATATKYLTVDNSGRVILAASQSGTSRSFTASPSAGVNISYGDVTALTFNLPTGTNLSQPATVVVSPKNGLSGGVRIDWATVSGPNTIQVGFSCPLLNSGQSFTTSTVFYFTVTEF